MQQILHATRPPLPALLHRILPERLLLELATLPPAPIEELRLRRERPASVTCNGENSVLRTVLGCGEMDALLLALCEGSLYAHDETLCRGYIMLKNGVRVGICGKATVVDGRVIGVREIGSYVFRFPCPAPHVGGEICALLRRVSPRGGVLIYAPPGEGKTTLLRGVAAQMSSGPEALRVSIVDTRGELAPEGGTAPLCDLLAGYPRGIGISIATRTLSAQLIVCDEIGDLSEAQEILHAHSCGVPLLAAAHGKDLRELLLRPGIAALHRARVFAAYVGISRRELQFEYQYHTTAWEAADALY